jgi:hypothetical protein
MEKAQKFLPLIIGGIVAILVFLASKKAEKSKDLNEDRNAILEKAREAKLAKSILNKSENEETSNNLSS